MSEEVEYVSIEYDNVDFATDRAVLVIVDDDGPGCWIPISMIKGETPEAGKGAGSLEIPEWLALDKGLI